MLHTISKIKDDLQVVYELSCFVRHPVCVYFDLWVQKINFLKLACFRKIKIAQQLAAKQRGESRMDDDEEDEEEELEDGTNFEKKFGSTETMISRYYSIRSETNVSLNVVFFILDFFLNYLIKEELDNVLIEIRDLANIS